MIICHQLRTSHGSVVKALEWWSLVQRTRVRTLPMLGCHRYESLAASGKASVQNCSRAPEKTHFTRGYVQAFSTRECTTLRGLIYPTSVTTCVLSNVQERAGRQSSQTLQDRSATAGRCRRQAALAVQPAADFGRAASRQQAVVDAVEGRVVRRNHQQQLHQGQSSDGNDDAVGVLFVQVNDSAASAGPPQRRDHDRHRRRRCRRRRDDDDVASSRCRSSTFGCQQQQLDDRRRQTDASCLSRQREQVLSVFRSANRVRKFTLKLKS